MSTTTTDAVQPDLAAVKQRQQQTWASADYAAVAALIVPMAEGLAQNAGLRAGDRVLDLEPFVAPTDGQPASFVKELSFIDDGLWGFEVTDADGYVLAFFRTRDE